MSLQRSVEQQFSRLQGALERAREEVREVLEGELRRVASQAEGIQAHLHLRISQLKKCLVSGERFSNNKNDVDFMQVNVIHCYDTNSIYGKMFFFPLFLPVHFHCYFVK